MNDLARRPYFFDAGIHFQCQQCGGCCTGAPGVVRVTMQEMATIADHLGMPQEEWIQRYAYPWEDGHSIREAADGRCLFFDAGCQIYPVRPSQCRTFPFWMTTLRSEKRWAATCRHCPGIGKGRLFTRNEILDTINNCQPTPI